MEGIIPETLEHALFLMAKYDLLPVAGGTDVMVRYKRWKNLVPSLPLPPIFIGHLEELKGIERKEDYIVIKSATSLSDIEKSQVIPSILKEAVSQMAAPAVRNMGTIGGNIANSSPAGDTLPPLYILDAEVVLLSKDGRRCMPVWEFITGPGKNKRQKNEILYEIRFKEPEYTHMQYKKVGTRKANALSKLSFVALANIQNGQVLDIRVAFGAVAPTPIRVKAIEDTLKGRSLNDFSDEFIKSIKERYSNYIKPIDDQRSTALYRKKVSLRLLGQFLKGFMER